MTVASIHQETAEAICSALFQTHFEPLGETEGGRVSWFHRGERPKDVRVRVERSPFEAEVKVVVEWRNFAAGARLKGEQTLHVPTGPLTPRSAIEQASSDAVVRVLEVYRDVISESGVAGPISQLVDTDPDSD